MSRSNNRRNERRRERTAQARVRYDSQYDVGARREPSEAEMLARLEARQGLTWSQTANRKDIMPHVHGKGSGSTRERKTDY